MFLSKVSKYGIWGFVLALPLLVNLGTVVYLTLGFLVMTLVLAKDIAPAILYNNTEPSHVRKLTMFIVSFLFSASIIALIYWVSFHLIE